MKISDAATAFSALSQDTRLSIVRLLVRNGPAGMTAGSIATEIGVAASTLSFHLSHLEKAGLVRAVREGRYIFYSADHSGLQALGRFLIDDCCDGRPELCGMTSPNSGPDISGPETTNPEITGASCRPSPRPKERRQ